MKPFNFTMTACGAKRPPSMPLTEPFRLIAPLDRAAAAKPLKTWLTTAYGAQFTEENFKAGVQAWTEIPQDFQELSQALTLAVGTTVTPMTKN